MDHDEESEKKFDPSGYDKDLVAALERDIVQRNPNVHWYVDWKNYYSKPVMSIPYIFLSNLSVFKVIKFMGLLRMCIYPFSNFNSS